MAGKFIVKAKQHIFETGEKVSFEVPMLPSVSPRFSNKVDVTNLFDKTSFEDMSFKAFFTNGKVFKGKLDEYGRTERIAAENNETVKVLIGDDSWHYVINYLGGDKTKPIYMKFVDNLGEPIANLEIKLTDDDLSELVVATTDSVGEVALPAIDYDYPILMVKNMKRMNISQLFV